mmetsp:Transcript_8955/g.15347  ORF Transcript_8955/g.15347 Transcript_8955/m.15347 type:complete len:316 (+) Transcript_8955:368-1315(+)|eukprot:CAMPEP_0198211874 /NCGR_PEP_ID=MMETSP1445-20131203/25391_1 /TAXON_ID=36898 /ORGANISM="Pyramimonas sp., Strain CCMP2087" /LENGTH=315 /DNA_ID=CAMNT_0043886225 /DNA_START=335 /DNA_END=1282 /DNA_ORIENTATION=+
MASTFLTQFGVEHYDGLEKYTVSSTSQSTVLLQKKKRMQEVQSELDRKKLEYKQRMKKCSEKEQELAEKQARIREAVVRFEKFVKENDAKRARAVKKERDESTSRLQKEQEIGILKQEHQELAKTKEKYLRLLEKLSVFESYVESVLEPSQNEFHEIDDVLRRHSTLTHTNKDLRHVVEQGNHEIEELRGKLSQFHKDKQDEILIATSDIAGQQKRSDFMKNENSKVEQELQYRDNAYNDRKRRLGEAKMAIRNIYQRCKKGNVPHEDLNNFDRLLEYVQNRLLDLGAIARMQKECNEYKLDPRGWIHAQLAKRG